MKKLRVLVVLSVMLAAACGRGARGSSETGAAGGALATSLEVLIGERAVRLVLHVTNPTREPVRLEFTSGQRYDFVVRTAAGADVWRWSADRMFMQALAAETLAPGASLRYEAEWDAGGRTGSFEAVGTVVSTNHRVEQKTRFELPGRF